MDQISEPEFRTQLSVPSLIVAAGDDKVVNSQAAEELGDYLHTASCLTIDGAMHEQFHERDVFREQLWAAFDAFIPGS